MKATHGRQTRTLILGAGLGGISTGYHLGGDYLVCEAAEKTAGMRLSVRTRGFTFDLGVHILYFISAPMRELMVDEAGLSAVSRNKIVRIFMRGAQLNYPFQAGAYGLPVEMVTNCIVDFARAKAGSGSSPATGRSTANRWDAPSNTRTWGAPIWSGRREPATSASTRGRPNSSTSSPWSTCASYPSIYGIISLPSHSAVENKLVCG